MYTYMLLLTSKKLMQSPECSSVDVSIIRYIIWEGVAFSMSYFKG